MGSFFLLREADNQICVLDALCSITHRLEEELETGRKGDQLGGYFSNLV